MDLMHYFAYVTLLLTLLVTLIAESTARPFADLDTFVSTPLEFDDTYFPNYPQRTVVSQKNSLLSRLRRGYYYIDDGEITPVNPNEFQSSGRRRQDTPGTYNANDADNSDNVRYTPLVRYHQTKHKKLFVPNLFG
ncbi:hypothetical protein DOY81_009608 [Sarcophaga bullata]|nr:hypothetical protein DOY81_009608 [Sarcophaga bullata]